MKPARTLSSAEEKKLLVGLAVQPFVGAALGFVLFPLVDYTGSLIQRGRAGDLVDAASSFAIGVGVVASFVTGFGAYPALQWVLKRGPLTRGRTLIAGAVLGNLPCALIAAVIAGERLSRGVTPTLSNTVYGPAGALRVVVLGTVIGLVSAAVFWWLSGRHLGERRG